MGLFDLFIGSVITSRSSHHNPDFVRVSINSHKKETIIIFLGWKMRIHHLRLLYSKFPEFNKIIYQLPTTLLSGDLELMDKSWKKLLSSVDKDLKENNVTTVYGISLGTAPALYFGNKSASIKKIILAMPPDRLSPFIRDSFLTRSIVEEAKRRGYTQKDMDKILSKYDTINNLDCLKNKQIRVYLAKADSVILNLESMKLISEMRRRKLNLKLKEMPILGHYLGGVNSVLFTRWMR